MYIIYSSQLLQFKKKKKSSIKARGFGQKGFHVRYMEVCHITTQPTTKPNNNIPTPDQVDTWVC